jgi:hypothetical protein
VEWNYTRKKAHIAVADIGNVDASKLSRGVASQHTTAVPGKIGGVGHADYYPEVWLPRTSTQRLHGHFCCKKTAARRHKIGRGTLTITYRVGAQYGNTCSTWYTRIRVCIRAHSVVSYIGCTRAH